MKNSLTKLLALTSFAQCGIEACLQALRRRPRKLLPPLPRPPKLQRPKPRKLPQKTAAEETTEQPLPKNNRSSR